MVALLFVLGFDLLFVVCFAVVLGGVIVMIVFVCLVCLCWVVVLICFTVCVCFGIVLFRMLRCL